MTSRVVTVRLPLEEYERASALAQKRRLSLNRLFQEGLYSMEWQEQERQLFDDFTRIGEAAGEADVEFALDAQNEATTPS